jgi:hypothetical protein
MVGLTVSISGADRILRPANAAPSRRACTVLSMQFNVRVTKHVDDLPEEQRRE